MCIKKIGWSAEYELDEMFEDTWRWRLMNPNGYSNIKYMTIIYFKFSRLI